MAEPPQSPPPQTSLDEENAMADQPQASQPAAAQPAPVLTTLPSAEEVVSRLSDLTAIEGNLTSSFVEVTCELEAISKEEQELVKLLKQVRERKQTQHGLVDEAEAVLTTNRANINRVRAGLGSLFGATAVPDNIAELLTPYQVTKSLLVKLPFKGFSTDTSSHKSAATPHRKTAKRSRVGGEDDNHTSEAVEEEDEEDYDSAGSDSRKKRKRNKGSDSDFDENGLLKWYDKKTPPYLLRNQCIIHVIHPPRELTRDQIFKLKGKYFSLACPVCKGNYSKGGNTYLRGLNGMGIHVRGVHRDHELFGEMKDPYLLLHCMEREVDKHEIMRLRQGEEHPTVVEAFCESRDNHLGSARRSARANTTRRRSGRASAPRRRSNINNSNIDPTVSSQAFEAAISTTTGADALLGAFTEADIASANDTPPSPAARSTGEETTVMEDNTEVEKKE